MSVLIEDLGYLLNPLASGGAWYMVNTTEPPVYPFIVFSRISSTPNVTLDGPSDLQNTRFQIDIYSAQISEAQRIDAALSTAMQAWATKNVPLSAHDMYEDAPRVYRLVRDFSVWATN
jgi:hypothetical protein